MNDEENSAEMAGSHSDVHDLPNDESNAFSHQRFREAVAGTN